MINKIYKYSSIILILSFFLVGCNNLDQTPTDQETDDTFWESEENSELLVNMAYSQMYSASKLWTDEALADNIIQGRDNNDPRKIRNGLATSSLGLFASEWKWAYEGIKTCHRYIENVDKIPGMSANLKQTRLAEIRFIRAFLFFRMANFYGDIPFFTKDITLAESKTISRTHKATVLAFIHSELDEIMNILPTKAGATDKGRITNAAAVALQARAYLYENNYEKVEYYTNLLINNQSKYGTMNLFSNYESLFYTANKYCDEIILSTGYATNNRSWQEMRSRVPMTVGANLNSCAPVQELVDNYITLNGKSIDNDSTYNSNLPYQNRDPRLTNSIVYDGSKWTNEAGVVSTIRTAYATNTSDSWTSVNANNSITGYYIKKYYDPESRKILKDYKQYNDIVIFRYADILLMYAEAMFEQNKMDQTVWDKTIKPIRERAGFTLTSALDYPSTMSNTDMRQLIRSERRSEFAFEGLRYFDIIRWNIGSAIWNGTRYGAKFANNNTTPITLDTWKYNEGTNYLWSVPLEEIVKNPNLKPNNSGY